MEMEAQVRSFFRGREIDGDSAAVGRDDAIPLANTFLRHGPDIARARPEFKSNADILFSQSFNWFREAEEMGALDGSSIEPPLDFYVVIRMRNSEQATVPATVYPPLNFFDIGQEQ